MLGDPLAEAEPVVSSPNGRDAVWRLVEQQQPPPVAVVGTSVGTTSFTPMTLAEHIGGRLVGDHTALVIERIDTLDAACPKTVSWASSEGLLDRVRRSSAGVVVVPAKALALNIDGGGASAGMQRCLIGVDDPELAVVRLLHLFAGTGARSPGAVAVSGVESSGSLHASAHVAATACVDGSCVVGPGVSVGAGAVVGARTRLGPGVSLGVGVRVGCDCDLRSNVVVEHGCVIGDRVVMHANTTIGADGFGYIFRDGRHVKIPQIGIVVIEDDVEIGANSCVDRARTGVTRVGRGAKIDNHVQIAHNCDIGEHVVIAAMTGIGGSTELGAYVMVAGHVGIADHLKIGPGARIAAKSAVTRNVRPGEVMRGYPAVENDRYVREQLAIRKLPKVLEKLGGGEADG